MVKILLDAPKSMIDFCLSPEASEKPYDICLQCPFMRESCDGPNVLAMEYPRWVEWAKNRIKLLGVTRSKVAEDAGIPLSTLNNALAGANYDIRTETMRRITKAIIGGCWGQYPCHLAAILMSGADLSSNDDSESEKIAALEAENQALKSQLKQTIEAAEAKVEEFRRESQTKIDFLKDQVTIRDKYLAEKNQLINELTMAIIRKQ